MIAFRSSWNSGLDRHEEPLDHYAPQHHLAGRISSNISVTVFDLIAEFGHHQQSTDPTEQIGIVDPTDVLSTEELLMPLWAYRTAAVYLFLISFLGVIMNVIVVIVILNDPQKTPLNWMLLNLACSDGTIAVFGTPLSTVAAFQTGWHFSQELCVAYAMIMSTAGIGSIVTLTVLALWRCTLVVCYPAHRTSLTGNSRQFSRRQAALLLTLIWTYTLAVTCPPLFGWGRYDREASHISCSVNWESKMDNNRSYIFYLFGMGLILPLLAITISYASILQVVRKTSEIRKKTLSNLQSNLGANQQSGNQGTNTTSGNQRDNHQPATIMTPNDSAEKRVTIMVACMIGAFMTAWTPYAIMALVETFTTASDDGSHGQMTNQVNSVGHISPGLATVPSLFAKTSAVLNPLIYGLLNTQFKSAWERFSLRFQGRRRRHHHRHRGHQHHQRICSQDLFGNNNVTGNTERRHMRSFIRQHPATVQLPMKEINPMSSTGSADRATGQDSKMASRGTPSKPSASPALPVEPQSNPDKCQNLSSIGSLLASTTSSLSFREMTLETNAVEMKTHHDHHQPVALVVVRLLSNANNGFSDKHATSSH